MQSSVLREILKLADRPNMISLAGGLPAADAFPISALQSASQRVFASQAEGALQYNNSEGWRPLREWVAHHLQQQGMQVNPDHVLITAGSQQGLDMVGKVLIDSHSRVRVEHPTYLGALQAFTPYEPQFITVPPEQSPSTVLTPQDRLAYLIPNFQNPTGRCMSLSERHQWAQAAQALGMPIVEDNPYGELWYDEPPPPAIASLWPQGVIYLGSFSKVLVPGFRLGYAVLPEAVFPKFLQVKQATDLHTSGFTQRIVMEWLRTGELEQHIQQLRTLYQQKRDWMAQALQHYMPSSCTWEVPKGGMFFWVRLPLQMTLSTLELLNLCVAQGVAFVPGDAFFSENPQPAMRLSFVTVSQAHIERGIQTIAQTIHQVMNP